MSITQDPPRHAMTPHKAWHGTEYYLRFYFSQRTLPILLPLPGQPNDNCQFSDWSIYSAFLVSTMQEVTRVLGDGHQVHSIGLGEQVQTMMMMIADGCRGGAISNIPSKQQKFLRFGVLLVLASTRY